MTAQLALKSNDFDARAVSPMNELGAYEALWLRKGATFKKLADLFRENRGAVPSDFVDPLEAETTAMRITEALWPDEIYDFGVRVHGAGEYPQKLRDAKHPIEVLYYRGWWDLVETKGVAVVGTREPSQEGRARAAKIARLLVANDYTVVSGLARGIDTVAHSVAMEAGGRTIAVLGTPINRAYPKENKELQESIAKDFLLISQVPILRHMQAKDPRVNSYFFPERNVTMSALTLGTVIVEAGETSGTLHQARAALEQGRKLFILESCFRNPKLTWPAKFAELGAIRVSDESDILVNLQ